MKSTDFCNVVRHATSSSNSHYQWFDFKEVIQSHSVSDVLTSFLTYLKVYRAQKNHEKVL